MEVNSILTFNLIAKGIVTFSDGQNREDTYLLVGRIGETGDFTSHNDLISRVSSNMDFKMMTPILDGNTVTYPTKLGIMFFILQNHPVRLFYSTLH